MHIIIMMVFAGIENLIKFVHIKENSKTQKTRLEFWMGKS